MGVEKHGFLTNQSYPPKFYTKWIGLRRNKTFPKKWHEFINFYNDTYPKYKRIKRDESDIILIHSKNFKKWHWGTKKEFLEKNAKQIGQINKKRCEVFNYKGKYYSLKSLAKELGISVGTLKNNICNNRSLTYRENPQYDTGGLTVRQMQDLFELSRERIYQHLRKGLKFKEILIKYNKLDEYLKLYDNKL